MLLLVKHEDGTFTHTEVLKDSQTSISTWAITDYTEYPCTHDPEEGECDCEVFPYDCSECEEPIFGEHFVCMDDGSDNAHIACTIILGKLGEKYLI